MQMFQIKLFLDETMEKKQRKQCPWLSLLFFKRFEVVSIVLSNSIFMDIE